MKLIILTGKLGTGKTTLMNNLIKTIPKNTTYSVIINEFAQYSVDSKSIKGDTTQINNGCVCCTKGDDLVKAIKKNKDKDYVLVETTGVTSLENLATTLKENRIKVDHIALLLDAKLYEQSKGFSASTQEQIKIASAIIINKQDLVQKSTLEIMKNQILQIDPDKDVQITQFSNVELNQIKNKKVKERALKKTLYQKSIEYLFPEYKFGLESRHIQKQNIKSISYNTNKPVSLDVIEDYFKALPKKIVRAKGTLTDGKKSYIFNYAYGLFYFEESRAKIADLNVSIIGPMGITDKYNCLVKLDKLLKIKTTSSRKVKHLIAAIN